MIIDIKYEKDYNLFVRNRKKGINMRDATRSKTICGYQSSGNRAR